MTESFPAHMISLFPAIPFVRVRVHHLAAFCDSGDTILNYATIKFRISIFDCSVFSPLAKKRRGRDSNPGTLASHTLSRRARSTAPAPLQIKKLTEFIQHTFLASHTLFPLSFQAIK